MATNTLDEKVLDDFREQWKQEVTSRQQQHSQQHSAIRTAATGHDHERQTESLSLPEQLDNTTLDDGSDDDTSDEEPGEQEPVTALAHYIKAIDHERQGQLEKALLYYRQAFRLNRDIDYVYRRHYQTHILPELQKEEQQLKSQGGGEPSSGGLDHSGEGSDGVFRHIVPIGVEYQQPAITSATKSFAYTWKDPLTDLIEEFASQDTDYVAALDYKPVLISKLPNEILLAILKHLFLKSLSSSAKVALVCKRLFLLTRSPSLWQFLCEHAYRQPNMTLTESRRIQADQVLRYYGGGWYNMYIQRPRIRYDGVYISTCHYIRSGTSKTTWNQPVHLVTYYRYLRFFTDGTLIKHVTTDEPAQVVKQLDQDYSKQQTFRGHFAWKQDDNGDGKQPMTVLKIDTRDDNLPHERFFLQLDVKGTHRGRHNKLGWRKYTSVNQRHINEYRRQRHDNDPLDALDEDDSMEGLEHVYDLKLMKPYFFSPVRSYRVDYPSDDDDDDGLV